MSKNVAAIICAAGASSRFGGNRKKPFIEVSGRAAFIRSIEYFVDRENIKQIILAINPDDDEIVKIKWGANLSFNGVKLCHGGTERFETVAKALELLDPDIELIAVHDSVRCCLTKEWVDNVLETASKTGAAILACPVVPTLKKITDGIITGTVDRTDLYEAQTPQIFEKELLIKAYANIDNLDKTPARRYISRHVSAFYQARVSESSEWRFSNSSNRQKVM